MLNNPLHIKTYPREQLNEISIKCIRGNIECFAHDEDHLRIEVYAAKFSFSSFDWIPLSKEEFDHMGFRIHKETSLLSISQNDTEFHGFLGLLESKRVSFRLFLPKNFSCTAYTDVGDVRIQGLTGTQRFYARIGSIYLENLHGTILGLGKNFGKRVMVNNCHGGLKFSSGGSNLEVKNSSGEHEYHTDGGNIRIFGFKGKVNCRTRGGNISIDNFEGELKSTTWGGNIKAVYFEGNMAGNTLGGNISVQTTKVENYLWLETSGGNIELLFPENIGLDLLAKGSRVMAKGRFQFQGQKTKGKWQGRVNEGGPNIRLKTAGGRVRLFGNPAIRHYQPEEKSVYTPPKTEYATSAFAQTKQASKPSRKRPLAAERKKEKEQVKAEAKSLKNLPKFSQALLALGAITLLVYGINTIVFFTTELFKPQTPERNYNQAVFFLNLINGLATFSAVWIFINFFDRKIRHISVKYITIILFTFVIYFFTHWALQSYSGSLSAPNGFWQSYGHITRMRASDGSQTILQGLLFTAVPCVATVAFYAFWNRSKDLNQRLSDQELQLLNLEKLKTKAQLDALEARINPHFLYNSLNSIAGLIHENPDRAEDMTIELSKLFRATTGRKNESFHSIEEEIDLVKSYLEIEQMRFGERLSYSIDVEPELNAHRIPRFLLQPLVENAIKHGISKIIEEGVIHVKIKTLDENIQVEIHDNGPAFGEAISGGYGLKSVQDKLDLIYEGKASLKIMNEPIKKLTILLDKNHAL